MTRLPHLRLDNTATSVPYSYAGPRPNNIVFDLPPCDRVGHANQLKDDLTAAVSQADAIRAGSTTHSTEEGLVLTFRSEKNYQLQLASLERLREGIQLLSHAVDDGVTTATVYVLRDKIGNFLRILDRYKNEDKVDEDGTSKPKHKQLVESIASIRLAIVRDFWRDAGPFPPQEQIMWWEVWVRAANNGDAATFRRFQRFAAAAQLRVAPHYITFPERLVLLAYGSPRQFSQSIDLLCQIAELRRAKELPTDYVDLSPKDQADFAKELAARLQLPPSTAPAVCLLDTGVHRGHPLLEKVLDTSDAHAIDVAWGVEDHDHFQHGTGMAGVALYGNLADILAGPPNERVVLRHCLESVKILPPPPASNQPELYGWVTQEGVARAEIQSPLRNRVICMAITTDDRDVGCPSAWSAAIDQMISGALDENPKLMFISAGNVRTEFYTPAYVYPKWNCQNAGIEDPAQSWNAITVGAYTDMVTVRDPALRGWTPVGTGGDLCPTSRTSLSWAKDSQHEWPIKPDIVMEGGNYVQDHTHSRRDTDDLSILTTALTRDGRLFQTTRDTSPATASAARMAAIIWSHYPKLRPETIRGLMVHSARWTHSMQQRFPEKSKTAIHSRLRCYGYGVPNLQRALWSAQNAATMIYEGELQPYRLDKSTVKTKDMHFHQLPWPVDVLRDLGDTNVTMHVTLSYYIEPSPGRRWTQKHRYQSHGLRFDIIRGPYETLEGFRKRITATEWDDQDVRPDNVQETKNWTIGDRGRRFGSIHSDWWTGSANELSSCNYLAVYPVTGWWKERRHLGKWNQSARYTLIVSIETPDQSAQLYAGIVNQATISPEIIS